MDAIRNRPGAGVCGFSMIVGTLPGFSCAPRRPAGGACHRSADSRRQAYASRGGESARAAPVRAVCSRRRAVDKCSGSAGNAGRPERNDEIFAWNGTGFASFRTGPRPDLPSLMPRRAPATGPRRCIPGPGSTDFGVGSIDFSSAASRPGPREYRQQRPLLPASRPPRWRPASGSGRFPSRSRLISTRVPAPRPRSNGAPCPAAWPRSVAPGTRSARPGSRPARLPTRWPAATAYHRWLILRRRRPVRPRHGKFSTACRCSRVGACRVSGPLRAPGFPARSAGIRQQPAPARPVWVSRPDASAARPAAPGRSGSAPPSLHRGLP